MAAASRCPRPGRRLPASVLAVAAVTTAVWLARPARAYEELFRGDVQPIPAVGESAWLDTESSVCVRITNAVPGQLEFSFSASFAATPSNNVSVAVGEDADGDGELSFGETDVVVGWDCGRYFWDRPRTGDRYEGSPTAGDAERAVSYVCRMPGRGGSVSSVYINGEAQAIPALEWGWRASWNMLRVTRRGLFPADGPSGEFRIRQQGALIQLL